MDNRRNSILKQPLLQQNDIDEDFTETYTFTRKRSLKRVSFAGRDEVKEFHKHETLLTEKIESVPPPCQTVSAIDLLETASLKFHSEENKENVTQEMEITTITTMQIEEIEMCSERTEIQLEDDMELTSHNHTNVILQSTNNSYDINHVEMDVTEYKCHLNSNPSTEYAVIEQHIQENPTPSSTFDKTISEPNCMEITQVCDSTTDNSVEMQNVMEFPLQQVDELPKLHAATENQNTSNFTDACLPELPSMHSPPTVAEPVGGDADTDSLKMTEQLPTPLQNTQEPNTKDFMEGLKCPFNWCAERKDDELILSNLNSCFLLKLELNHEYTYHGVRHYLIEEIEIDTKKGLQNLWARMGLLILENTLENSNLKSKCPSTEDLDKLFHFIEDYRNIFKQFLLYDSETFELLVNPRSLKVDLDNFLISFELSNMENVLLIRITMKLAPVFPLTATEFHIDNVIGKVNHSELVNMLAAISPNDHYLTRVCECIEDYLRFPPSKPGNWNPGK